MSYKHNHSIVRSVEEKNTNITNIYTPTQLQSVKTKNQHRTWSRGVYSVLVNRCGDEQEMTTSCTIATCRRQRRNKNPHYGKGLARVLIINGWLCVTSPHILVMCNVKCGAAYRHEKKISRTFFFETSIVHPLNVIGKSNNGLRVMWSCQNLIWDTLKQLHALHNCSYCSGRPQTLDLKTQVISSGSK